MACIHLLINEETAPFLSGEGFEFTLFPLSYYSEDRTKIIAFVVHLKKKCIIDACPNENEKNFFDCKIVTGFTPLNLDVLIKYLELNGSLSVDEYDKNNIDLSKDDETEIEYEDVYCNVDYDCEISLFNPSNSEYILKNIHDKYMLGIKFRLRIWGDVWIGLESTICNTKLIEFANAIRMYHKYFDNMEQDEE